LSGSFGLLLGTRLFNSLCPLLLGAGLFRGLGLLLLCLGLFSGLRLPPAFPFVGPGLFRRLRLLLLRAFPTCRFGSAAAFLFGCTGLLFASLLRRPSLLFAHLQLRLRLLIAGVGLLLGLLLLRATLVPAFLLATPAVAPTSVSGSFLRSRFTHPNGAAFLRALTRLLCPLIGLGQEFTLKPDRLLRRRANPAGVFPGLLPGQLLLTAGIRFGRATPLRVCPLARARRFISWRRHGRTDGFLTNGGLSGRLLSNDPRLQIGAARGFISPGGKRVVTAI
jgi:hypothetical protein